MGYYPIFICHCYDIIANLAASRNDTGLVINLGLTVSEDKHGNLAIKGRGESTILNDLDSKEMVENLCTSQKYISWSYFLTFTENQSRNLEQNLFKNG